MRQQGVDLARFRDKVSLRLRVVGVTTADVTNEALKIVDVAINVVGFLLERDNRMECYLFLVSAEKGVEKF